jgi:hypothetical protein
LRGAGRRRQKSNDIRGRSRLDDFRNQARATGLFGYAAMNAERCPADLAAPTVERQADCGATGARRG